MHQLSVIDDIDNKINNEINYGDEFNFIIRNNEYLCKLSGK